VLAGRSVVPVADGAERVAAGWTPEPVPTYAGRSPVLYAVAAVSPSLAWAAGSRSVANVDLSSEVIRTTDGGASWTIQWSPGGCCEIVGLAAASPSVLWAVRSSVCGGSDILHSVYGGDTWTSRLTGTGTQLWGITAPTTSTVWAVGYLGTIFTTSDGGASWRARFTSVDKPLWAVSAASSTIGWAVGSDGTILNTVDGGVTWTTQRSSVTEHLLGVSAASATEAWVVGVNGVVLKTADGGATWSGRTPASWPTSRPYGRYRLRWSGRPPDPRALDRRTS
jgi:photosystem II stability/assembly factor-like uncharacterized protein